MKNTGLYMPSEATMAELCEAQVTGADLNYIGSITIDRLALEASGLLPGQMVYIDDIDRKGPPWRTYIVPGEAGKGEIVMNGPPAYHFSKGDRVTIRGGALVARADLKKMGPAGVYFRQEDGWPNKVALVRNGQLPEQHLRQMCISKLHRLLVTEVAYGPEALVVDEDILDAADFPVGIEVQFTSLADGALRRTRILAGRRGTGEAVVLGSGAQHIKPGVRLVTLAEAWLPYEDAIKMDGPQVVFFDESVNDRNVIKSVKPGWRP